MEQVIRARYENGVFRPLEPIKLNDQADVSLVVRDGNATGPVETEEGIDRQRAAIQQMLERIETLPDEGPDDGFSGVDHDRILYGNQ